MSGDDVSETVSMNLKGLDDLIKALKVKPPIIRVGILGSKDQRQGKGTSNATIGAAHEFGTTILPQRSFLRIPLADNLQKQMESSGALDKDVLAQVVKEKTVLPWMQKIAVLAESIVIGAFDSNGYGKWKPSNMDSKKVKQTLVETGQLRNSITSEVKT